MSETQMIFIKFPTKLVSRLLIIAFITTTLWIQKLKSMECISMIEKAQNTSIANDNPDFHFYMLLSSIANESPFWLPANIIRSITINAHHITELLFDLKLDCSTTIRLLASTYSLNSLYSCCPNMSVALLKIYLHDNKTSLLAIKTKDSGQTVFDTTYDSGLKPEIEILCHLIDKKAFVDHFKELSSPLGFTGKTNLLHCLMWHDLNPRIIQLYCGVFIDYAHNCPKKSKEVLNLLKAKDDYGDTILTIAKKNGHLEIVAIFKSTIKALKRTIQEKENCVIQ